MLAVLCLLASTGGALGTSSVVADGVTLASDEPDVELHHADTVGPDETFVVIVETHSSAGTVLEVESETADVELSSDEGIVHDGRVEFFDASAGDSTYTVTVDVQGGTTGDEIELVGLVDADDPEEAAAVATATVELEDDPDDSPDVQLFHDASVGPGGEFLLTVETTASAGTVVEVDAEGADVTLDSDDGFVVDDGRVEFVDPTAGASIHTVSGNVVGGSDGATVDVAAWVNAGEREDAPAVATSTVALGTGDGDRPPGEIRNLRAPSSVETGETASVDLDVANATTATVAVPTEGVDVDLASDDAASIGDDRVRFEGSGDGTVTHAVDLTPVSASGADEFEVVAWIDGETRADATAVRTATIGLEADESEERPARVHSLDALSSIEPGATTPVSLAVGNATNATLAVPTEDVDLAFASEDATAIGDDHVRFEGSGDGPATYAAELTVSDAGGVDEFDLLAWVDGETRDEAAAVGSATIEVDHGSAEQPGVLQSLRAPGAIEPDETATVRLDVQDATNATLEVDGTAVEFTSDAAAAIGDDRVRFDGPGEGVATYTVDVSPVQAVDGDELEIAAWVDGEARAEAADGAETSVLVRSVEPTLDAEVVDDRSVFVTAGPRAVEGGLTTDLPTPPAAEEDGLSVESLDLDMEGTEPAGIRLSQQETLAYASEPPLDVDTYLEVADNDVDVSEVQLLVAVDEDHIGDPDRFAALRLAGGAWGDVHTRHLGTNESAGVERFAVETAELGPMAFQTDRRQPTDAELETVSITNELDVQGNDRYADFDVAVSADTDVGPHTTPFFRLSVDGESIGTLPVQRDRDAEHTLGVPKSTLAAGGEGARTVRVELFAGNRFHGEGARDTWTRLDAWSTTVEYEHAAHEVTATEANWNTVDVSAGRYETFRTQSLNHSHWQACADHTAALLADIVSEQLEDEADDVTAGHLSAEDLSEEIAVDSSLEILERSEEPGTTRYARSVSRANVAIRTAELTAFVLSIVAGGSHLSDCYTVALHQNNPGYTATEYEELHTHLDALEANAQALEETDDPETEQELLEERADRIETLYALLPEYLEGAHHSVVEEAVEQSDLSAYAITRTFVEDLRWTLEEDHYATTQLLEEPRNEPLSDHGRMPTHGWTLQHTLGEALGDEVGPDAQTKLSLDYWRSLPSIPSELMTDAPERLGEHVFRSVTGQETFPEADRFGESTVYDTMERPDDYTLYRIGFDPDAVDHEWANAAIVRPLEERGSVSEFDVTLLEERPDRVTEPTASETYDGYTLESTDGNLEYELQFDPDQEFYWVLVEADGSAGHYQFKSSGEISGTTADVVARQGPNVLRPEIRLEDAPERSELRSGEEVHATTDSTVDLSWHAWDAYHAPEELQYRHRVIDTERTGDWSAWENVARDGTISESLYLEEGYHTVQLVVRDSDGKQAVDTRTVFVDTTVPEIDVDTVGDANSSTVQILVDQRVDYVELQYRDPNATDPTWQEWTTIQNVDRRDAIEFNRDGHYELRGRAVDFVGHVSDWDSTPFYSRVTVVEHEPDDSSTSSSGGVSSTGSTWSYSGGGGGGGGGGGSGGGSGPSGTISVGGGSSDSAETIETTVERIDGDLVMDVYVATREFQRVKLESIEFEHTDSEAAEVEVPPELGATTEITLEFRGEGEAQISGINVTVADEALTIEHEAPVHAGAAATLEAFLEDTDDEQIETFAWDFTDDGETDATGQTVSHEFDAAGAHAVTVTATDAFGDAVSETTVVDVGGPLTADAEVPATVDVGEALTAVADAGDHGTSIERYEWDLTGDGDVDATGRTVNQRLVEPGERNVTLTVTDARGATATTSATVSVERTPPTAALRTRTSAPRAASPIELSAGRSSDEGEVVAVGWDLPANATDTTVHDDEVAFTLPEPGTYEVTATVENDAGLTDVARETVEVGAPATVELDAPETATVGEAVDATVDATGDAALAWDTNGTGVYDDAQNETSIERQFETAGTHSVGVLATTEAGTTLVDRQQIDVSNPAGPAQFDVSPDDATEGDTVRVDLAREPVADETYEWTVGNATYSGPSANHTFETAGRYEVDLLVRHADGATRSLTRTVRVAGEPVPVLEYETPAVAGERVAFDGTASTPTASDVERYEWDLTGDGDVDATGRVVDHAFASAGVHDVELTVVDRRGARASAHESLTVLAPASVGVADVTPETASAAAGSNVTIEVEVANDGDLSATETVLAQTNGTVVGVTEVQLDGGNATTVDFSLSVPAEPRTTQEFAVFAGGDRANGTLTAADGDGDDSGGGLLPPPSPGGEVQDPPVSGGDDEASEPEIDVVGIEPEQPTVGQRVTVTIEVVNPADERTDHHLALFADGERVDETTATVGAGAELQRQLSGTFDEPGEYDLAVDDVDAGTVTVEAVEEGADDQETDGETDDDGTPGFGVVSGIAALLAALALARARGIRRTGEREE